MAGMILNLTMKVRKVRAVRRLSHLAAIEGSWAPYNINNISVSRPWLELRSTIYHYRVQAIQIPFYAPGISISVAGEQSNSMLKRRSTTSCKCVQCYWLGGP